MRTKNAYTRIISAILTVALFCSACGAQETEKQSFSATGAAVMTPSGVETETPAGIEEEETEDKKPEKTTKKDKDGTVWDISREVTVKEDGFTYHAYLSKDGKESWIYQADPGSGGESTLAFPEEVQGAVLTKLGKTPREDYYYDIFGNGLEPYHNYDAWEGADVGKKNVKKIVCPHTVKKVTAASFCGFRNMEEIVLPEKLQKISDYLLFFCKKLQKIVLPLSPDFTKSYVPMAECNHIKKVELPERSNSYCIKDGMLLSKDKKTLYQVFVTGKTVKVPEGVTRIATRAINATHITKIRSVWLPSTLKRLDHDAILEKEDFLDGGRCIKSVTVDDKNPFLVQTGSCIYEKATGTLMVFVGTRKSMTLPKEILYISDAHLQFGKSIKRLIIPSTFRGFKATKGQEERIGIGEVTEFCSIKPPEIVIKGEEEIPALGFLIVPKEGMKLYKEWYHRLHREKKLIVKTKGNKAYIAMEGYEDIMEQYGLISPKNE